MTSLTTSHNSSSDARQVPLAPRRRRGRNAEVALHPDLPSAHHTTTRTDTTGRTTR
jgi:hypothetical protein